jgi:hypothetical protein
MSGRLLTFSQYLGGADNVKIIEMFPSTSKTFKYTFGTDISNWNFESSYQSLLLDKVTYDRNTGEPNFTDTNILGYWNQPPGFGGASDIIRAQGSNPDGEVFFNIAPDRYTGQLFPNARENVVITVVGLTWRMNSPEPGVDPTTESHRWGIIERYLPGDHIPGDPALDPGFIPYGVGAVTSFTNINYQADLPMPDDFVYDTQFRYTDNDQNSPNSNGTGLSVTLTWTEGITQPRYGINSAGRGYRPGDIISIYDEQLGNGGSGITTITIGNVS